jgi:hypothetical protein
MNKIKNIIKSNSMIKFALVALCIAISHYLLINVYISMCVGTGVWGLFTSVIRLGSPVCQFINYVQFELSKYYITAWAAAAVSSIAWLIGKISD